MVCNPSGFGPPRACSARFALPMGSSPGFGSDNGDWSPFRTRVRSGSGCPCLSLAARWHSLAHSTKGTPSQDSSCSDRPEAHGFRHSFTPLNRGAFHRSLTVLVPYRSLAVFSLGGWSPQLPTRFRVSGSTHGCRSQAQRPRRLRDSHPLWSPVPEAFGCAVGVLRGIRNSLHLHRSTPRRQRSRARTPSRFGLLPVRSPLLGESSLFLAVLRCFTSRGSLPDHSG